MKKLSVFLASILLTGALSAETKFGAVDLKYVLENFTERAEAQKAIDEEQLALNEEKNAKVEELKGLSTELEELNKQLQDPTLSDKKRQTLNQEFAAKKTEAQKINADQVAYFQRKGQALQEKFREQQIKIVNTIKDATKEYAKANEYTYIFDSNALVYSADAEDISEEIVKIINK